MAKAPHENIKSEIDFLDAPSARRSHSGFLLCNPSGFTQFSIYFIEVTSETHTRATEHHTLAQSHTHYANKILMKLIAKNQSAKTNRIFSNIF